MSRPGLFKAAACVFLLGAAVSAGFAQEDAEGCKDHPLLSRMRNFYISDCSSNYDALEIYITSSEFKALEGERTYICYYLKEGAQQPSELQIRRNFGNALKSAGGELFRDEDNYLSARLVKGGREMWVVVQIYNNGGCYTLDFLEIGEMVQEVTAGEMLNALERDGFIALYINFDTGKADVKPESEGTVAQIVALLEQNPNLKVGIEGHTDNVGTAAANKTLSEQRAKAVLNAVVAGGIEAGRLTATGWGQERPIADNRSEDGRAKNRRVEIVKK